MYAGKCRLRCVAIFEKVSQNEHFQSTPLVGRKGVTKQEYSVYALDIVDNSGRTLKFQGSYKTFTFLECF